MFIVNGGKGANQAVAAARLQAKACFAGQMGKDDNATLLIKGNTQNNYNYNNNTNHFKYLFKII